jgi:co-chaperonin GroES (HSP10)
MKFEQESLGNRVILKPFVETVTKSGIVLAQSARSQAINTDKGEVLMVGPSCWYDQPEAARPKLKKGDKVFYAKYGCKTIQDLDDPEAFYILANDVDILVGYTNG